MKCKAILSRSTTDQIKSKILSPQLTQIVLDCYISPSEFGHLMETFFETSFDVEFTEGEKKVEFEKDINV